MLMGAGHSLLKTGPDDTRLALNWVVIVAPPLPLPLPLPGSIRSPVAPGDPLAMGTFVDFYRLSHFKIRGRGFDRIAQSGRSGSQTGSVYSDVERSRMIDIRIRSNTISVAAVWEDEVGRIEI